MNKPQTRGQEPPGPTEAARPPGPLSRRAMWRGRGPAPAWVALAPTRVGDREERPSLLAHGPRLPPVCDELPIQKRLCPVSISRKETHTPPRRPGEFRVSARKSSHGETGGTRPERGAEGVPRQRKRVWGGRAAPGRGWWDEGGDSVLSLPRSRHVGLPPRPPERGLVKAQLCGLLMKSRWRLLLPSLRSLDSTAKSLRPTSGPRGFVVSFWFLANSG